MTDFRWPGGRRCAVSLCFDDGKPSQLHQAVPALRARALSATFYLDTAKLEAARPSLRPELLRRWGDLRDDGHEIGNHSHSHPCTINFPWMRQQPRALEDFGLDDVAEEIARSQAFLADALGRRPATFAYPCGQTHVGRGEGRKSYVPLVAREFLVGRSFNDQAPAAPAFCDLACVPALPLDGRSAEHLLGLVAAAIEGGDWLVLVGHSVADRPAPLSTLRGALETLLDHLSERADLVWTDTVERVGQHVAEARHLTSDCLPHTPPQKEAAHPASPQ